MIRYLGWDDKRARCLGYPAVATGAREHRTAELAQGASEALRTVLSAAGGKGTIPLQIGMLDYAGLRIAADNRFDPPRWEDMTKAVLFANQQWSAIKSRIDNPNVVDAFDHVLVALQEGAAAHDSAIVGKAATRELELVDTLEKSVHLVPTAARPQP